MAEQGNPFSKKRKRCKSIKIKSKVLKKNAIDENCQKIDINNKTVSIDDLNSNYVNENKQNDMSR